MPCLLIERSCYHGHNHLRYAGQEVLCLEESPSMEPMGFKFGTER